MPRSQRGFSVVELMVVISMIMVILTFALPQAFQAVKTARLHSDASAVASELNVVRFLATSQFAPHRLVLTPTATPPSYSPEQLCGSNTTDSGCTASPPGGCAAPYNSYSSPITPRSEGTHYISSGDSLLTTNPIATANPGGITTSAGATTFFFNTRGMPVKCDGTPLGSGGSAIYVQNQDNLLDAVVVTVGGQISVYNWSAVQNKWALR